MSVRGRSGHAREDVVVARLHALAPSLDGEPDPGFRAATRARLVAMAAVRTPEPDRASGLRRLLAARAPDAAPAPWRRRLTAGLAGAALTVTALAGLVAVADGARPGDPLYDLKRGTEQTQLALAGDTRGQALLDFAGTRLDEVAALAGADASLVVETLRAMDEQTRQGTAWLTDHAVDTGNAQSLDTLALWAEGQSGELAELQPLVPGEAAGAVERSLTLLSDVGARADGLRAALGCPGGAALDGTDPLGPVPAACPAPDAVPPVAPAPPAPTDPAAPSGAVPTEVAPPAVPPADVPGTGVPGTTAPGRGNAPGGVPGGGARPTPTVPLPLPSISVQLPPVGPVPAPTSGDAAPTTDPLLRLCLPPLISVNCR